MSCIFIKTIGNTIGNIVTFELDIVNETRNMVIFIANRILSLSFACDKTRKTSFLISLAWVKFTIAVNVYQNIWRRMVKARLQ